MRGTSAAVLALSVLAACDRGAPRLGIPDAGPPPSVCLGAPDGPRCDGDRAVTCAGSRVAAEEDCAAAGEACVDGACLRCRPGTPACDGATLLRCNAAGTAFEVLETCEGTEQCSAAGCGDLCARAAEDESYLGCEYWPVTTLNSLLPRRHRFAVVVANPQLIEVEVRVERGGEVVAAETLPPGGLATLPLPWEPRLAFDEPARSVLVAGGAYRLTSTAPVTAYQLNPLDYALDEECPEQPSDVAGDGLCFSFTNDASLLLPTHALTGRYLGLSRATFLVDQGAGFDGTSGFLAVVGVAETPTTVEVEASAFVAAGDEVTAMAPGDRQTFRLGQGDVLQLVSARPAGCPGTTVPEGTDTYCDPGAAYDLTGTRIRAEGPVGVFGGHDCTFVPFDRWACDHLEEQLFPVEAWGEETVVVRTESLRGEPNLLRVLSGADGNTITFQPARSPPLTLDQGEFAEILLEGSVVLRGTGPFAAGHFLVAQDFAGRGSAGPRGTGDPAYALAIPTAQYRTAYTVLTPDTYLASYVALAAPVGVDVVLDGRVVTGGSPVEGTSFRSVNVEVPPGTHRLSAAAPFGVEVYGFGAYTSYLYPGGLDFRPIADPF